MKKFIVFIVALSLIIAVPFSPAFAGFDDNSDNKNNKGIINSGDIGSNNTNNGIIAGKNVNYHPKNSNNTTTNDVDISNKNYNTNVNANASSSYSEGGAGGDATINVSEGAVQSENNNTATATVNFPQERAVTTTMIQARGYRGFSSPAEITYAPLPGYFGKAMRNANVQPVEDIVMFKDTFTRADVKMLMKGVKVDANRNVEKVAKEDRKDTDVITVIFIAPDRSAVRQCAVITTRATSKETSSVNVMGAAILMGLDVGADLLFITAEGAASELRSFGWGIGLSYTRSTISHDEQTGGVSAGGMGISGGKAGYKSFPWLQSIALKIK